MIMFGFEEPLRFKKRPENVIFLHFQAVDYECIVYLNGKEVGRHIGGQAPFNFDVTLLFIF